MSTLSEGNRSAAAGSASEKYGVIDAKKMGPEMATEETDLALKYNFFYGRKLGDFGWGRVYAKFIDLVIRG